jgi:hypothetical protein
MEATQWRREDESINDVSCLGIKLAKAPQNSFSGAHLSPDVTSHRKPSKSIELSIPWTPQNTSERRMLLQNM